MEALTVLELIELFFRFVGQFGLPIAMFVGILYFLKRGDLLFKVSHDAEISAMRAHMNNVIKDNERLWNIAEPAVTHVEKSTEKLQAAEQAKS